MGKVRNTPRVGRSGPHLGICGLKIDKKLTSVELCDGELLEVCDERHHGEADAQVAGDVERALVQVGAGDLGGVEAEVPRRLERGNAALHVARQDEDVTHLGDLNESEIRRFIQRNLRQEWDIYFNDTF